MTAAVSSDLYWVGDATCPSTIEAIRHRISSVGLALFEGAYDAQTILAIAGQVMSITLHPDSDKRGITTIAELGPAAGHPNAEGFSRRELMAHTDRSGIPEPPALMMLACSVQARSGGGSRFCDGLAIYDDLAANSPESVRALSHRRSALFGGAAGYLGAVFTSAPGHGPARAIMRLRLDDLASFSPDIAEHIPRLTASISSHTITMTLQPGQGVILDNHRWLHARDTFEGPRRMYRLLGNPLADLEMFPGIPAEPVPPMSVANSQLWDRGHGVSFQRVRPLHRNCWPNCRSCEPPCRRTTTLPNRAGPL